MNIFGIELTGGRIYLALEGKMLDLDNSKLRWIKIIQDVDNSELKPSLSLEKILNVSINHTLLRLLYKINNGFKNMTLF